MYIVIIGAHFSGSEPRPTGLGLLHCTLQHFPVRKRLRVSILKIEEKQATNVT
ncbi:hypothetical protein ANCCAN_12965 [Ancylostoma caninum]|uniref:Uncharacterized protein n=1 Tax=Ancylostoma caninum TaxID=29170 RepID=A0A368G9P9_ANCCA|nr:hypothetical protein ANCCAN_12965 [Ancylostoma caninum]